jgi:hypothetical protein
MNRIVVSALRVQAQTAACGDRSASRESKMSESDAKTSVLFVCMGNYSFRYKWLRSSGTTLATSWYGKNGLRPVDVDERTRKFSVVDSVVGRTDSDSERT